MTNCESLVPGDLYVMLNREFDYTELRLLLSRDDDTIGYLVVKPRERDRFLSAMWSISRPDRRQI